MPERTTTTTAPSVGELLTALSKIPPQQRQAIVLREFEGRSYNEIAEILGVTTSALETLLFRARRSLAEELQHQLTCTEAQLAVSQSVDGRLGRKERRRLRDHLAECPDCARFARLQQRHRSALRGLALVPIPLSLTLFKGLEGSASAAVLPIGAGAGSRRGRRRRRHGRDGGGHRVASSPAGSGSRSPLSWPRPGSQEASASRDRPRWTRSPRSRARPAAEQPGARLGQVAPRGVTVPGNGVARGKASAPGQTKAATARSERGSTQAQKAKNDGARPDRERSEAQGRGSAQGRRTAQGRTAEGDEAARASTPTSRPPQATRAQGAPPKKAATAPKASSATPERANAAQGERGNASGAKRQRGRPEGTLSAFSSPPPSEGGFAPGNGRSRSHTCDSSLHSLPCRRLSSSRRPSPPRAHRRRWSAALRSRPRSSSR